jgi:hypothetical protein
LASIEVVPQASSVRSRVASFSARRARPAPRSVDTDEKMPPPAAVISS